MDKNKICLENESSNNNDLMFNISNGRSIKHVIYYHVNIRNKRTISLYRNVLIALIILTFQ